MQGNTTEIDERNLLRLDALLSHGYGLSPQLVMRSKGLSIEAKALYGYLSSFAGAGDTAFPSTSRILEELDISKNRFYKIRKELVSWGFISIETTATSAGLRTVYTLPQNPIAIKTEIDEIANRRNEIKSSLVANLHNEDMVSHKGDSESERLQQSAGNEPCRQSEAKAQNRGSNLKPCLQSEDEGCLQSGDKLYIDTNINPKVSIDRSAAHPSDDEGPSDWKVTEGMTDPTQRDDGESDRDANRRDALDAVPDGTYDTLPTVADGYTLSNSEFEAFNHLCSLSIKTVRGAVRNEAAKQYAKRLGEGYSPATIEKAYIDYAEAYRQNNPSPRFAKQLSDWFVNNDGLSPAREGGLTSDQDFALANYKMFKVAAGKTLKSIIISCNVRMAPMRIEQVRELLKYDEMNLDEMGDPGQRTAVFAIMSDTDKTFSFLHAIMMWQSIDILCRRALEKYNGKLPTMVNFIFDEFANIGTIPDIEQTIAVTRSRNIGISIILQSVAQLESRYDKKAKTIIDCCDTTLFLGGKSNSTNKEISEMIGKQTINQKTFGETRGQSGSSSKNIQIQGRDLIDAAEIGKMNRREAILLIAGTNPLKDLKYPVEQHPNYIYLDPGRNKPGQVKNRCLYDEPFDILEYMDDRSPGVHLCGFTALLVLWLLEASRAAIRAICSPLATAPALR